MALDQLQAALGRLASTSPRQLFEEARLERCRATRDLRACGRPVVQLFPGCNHASLCSDCLQRLQVCPVCRQQAASTQHVQHRLYEECKSAGLLQEGDLTVAGEQYGGVELARLQGFFNVALENSLHSLICHYVVEVCFDQTSVSSDPLEAKLLDPAVVKDWCRSRLHQWTGDLGRLYFLGHEELASKCSDLDKAHAELRGLDAVLEAMEAQILDEHCALAQDLAELRSTEQRVAQHLEVVRWCSRHDFLERLPSNHPSYSDWLASFEERQQAAQERHWPVDSERHLQHISDDATLFIEDAVHSLGLDSEDVEQRGETEVWLEQLREGGAPSSSAQGLAHWESGRFSEVERQGLYPPQSLRRSIDLLFLAGSASDFLAKKAIFLYYLFDRFWNCEGPTGWQEVLDDYCRFFRLPLYFKLECLAFYLLDNKDEEALKEACRLLPELTSKLIHPKIPQVLLERGCPSGALDILRSKGLFAALPSLINTVTALRVWLECGSLAEGYAYQRQQISRLRQEGLPQETRASVGEEDSSQVRDWRVKLGVLVREVVYYAKSKQCFQQLIDLPWDEDEEKPLVACLEDLGKADPSSCNAGHFLVLYYVQRCRYPEAIAAHNRLEGGEQNLTGVTDEEAVVRMRAASRQRASIVASCEALLPTPVFRMLQQAQQEPQPSTAMMDTDAPYPVPAPAFNSLPGLEVASPLLQLQAVASSELESSRLQRIQAAGSTPFFSAASARELSEGGATPARQQTNGLARRLEYEPPGGGDLLFHSPSAGPQRGGTNMGDEESPLFGAAGSSRVRSDKLQGWQVADGGAGRSPLLSSKSFRSFSVRASGSSPAVLAGGSEVRGNGVAKQAGWEDERADGPPVESLAMDGGEEDMLERTPSGERESSKGGQQLASSSAAELQIPFTQRLLAMDQPPSPFPSLLPLPYEVGGLTSSSAVSLQGDGSLWRREEEDEDEMVDAPSAAMLTKTPGKRTRQSARKSRLPASRLGARLR